MSVKQKNLKTVCFNVYNNKINSLAKGSSVAELVIFDTRTERYIPHSNIKIENSDECPTSFSVYSPNISGYTKKSILVSKPINHQSAYNSASCDIVVSQRNGSMQNHLLSNKGTLNLDASRSSDSTRVATIKISDNSLLTYKLCFANIKSFKVKTTSNNLKTFGIETEKIYVTEKIRQV